MSTAPKAAQNTQALRGQVEALFYSSPQFCAGRFKTGDGCKAMFAGQFCVREGDPVVLHGHWGMHAKYGRQFQVEWFEYDGAPSAEGLANYLAKHPLLKGIGPAKAWRIAEQFAEGFDEALAERPEEIARAAGVPLSTIETLAAEWKRVEAVRSALTILSAYGLTHHQVTTLVEKHGNSIVALLEADPYLLVGEIQGMGFKKVDKIARQLGTPKEHASRIRSGIMDCVHEALGNGHCWVEYEDLVDQANLLLVMDTLESRTLIEQGLEALIGEEKLACIPYGGRFAVALPGLHRMERDLAARFAQASSVNPYWVRVSDLESLLHRCAPSLNERQRDALASALRHSVSLISGGAGSGKSYTVSAITALCEDLDLDVVLAAPTGKAAKRLEEVSGRSAMTIHRLLGYDGKEFAKGPDDPVEADMLIVDEVSMVDVPLAWRLFDAVDFSRTAVVLVGDHNQLPPVGPGNILRDLIQTRAIPSVILDKIVRQAGVLKENSTAVLRGEVHPTSPARPDGCRDWYLVDQFTDALAARGFLLGLFQNRIEELGFDPLRDVQVLTPTHKGPLGTGELNEHLQRLLQKKLWGVDVEPVQAGRRPPLYPRDKVIQTRNNYELNVMNGSIGNVIEIKPDGTHVIDFDGAPVEVEKGSNNLRDLQLAYALTFHKCQGSEFPCALVVIHKSHSFMHHRNLFYTGVTRARRTAIVLGDRWGIRNCAARCQVDDRRTFLSLLLREGIQQPDAHDFHVAVGNTKS